MIERNLEKENASPDELQRNAEWKLRGFINAVNCPKLKGRITRDMAGIQYVETDSKEDGKRLIPCLGFTRIEGGLVGDWVEMTYKVHQQKNMAMWIGRLVKRSGE